jgi:hypothetical protein
MHTRHGALFRWTQERFPGGALYGPTTMRAGATSSGWLEGGTSDKCSSRSSTRRLHPGLDGQAHADFAAMRQRYRLAAGTGDLPDKAPDAHHP